MRLGWSFGGTWLGRGWGGMEGVNHYVLGSRNAWVQGRLVLPRTVLMNLNLGGAVLMNLDFIL